MTYMSMLKGIPSPETHMDEHAVSGAALLLACAAFIALT